jgi:predicted metal-binding membrane protein
MKWPARKNVRHSEKNVRRSAMSPDSEGEWHCWFAWYPVAMATARDSTHWVWLEFVERKWRTSKHGSGRKRLRYRLLPVNSKPYVQQRLHNLAELTRKLDVALCRADNKPSGALRRAARDPFRFQRNVVMGLLLALVAAAWTVLVWQHADATMDMATASVTIGPRAPLFLVIWVIMMVAMMLPTAAPMILTFHRVQAANRQLGDAFVTTWVFVAAYLLVWACAGMAAYAGMLAAETAAARLALPPATTAQIAGAIIMVAGIYELTPLKDVCLSKCRRPMDFIVTSWRDGATSALEMGLLHGAYCLGCCWLLFVILFPLGIMNLGAMAAVTLFIFAEKTLPWPRVAPYAAAVALVLYGALVITSPKLLPTFQQDGDAAMPAEMQMGERQCTCSDVADQS